MLGHLPPADQGKASPPPHSLLRTTNPSLVHVDQGGITFPKHLDPSPTLCPPQQHPPGSISSPTLGMGCWEHLAAGGCHGKLNVKLSGMLFMLPSGEEGKKN